MTVKEKNVEAYDLGMLYGYRLFVEIPADFQDKKKLVEKITGYMETGSRAQIVIAKLKAVLNRYEH